MTWPELVALELGAQDGTRVMVEPTCEECRKAWACVVRPGEAVPRWCLSCWRLLLASR
jgi:hypothetical protein